MNTSLIAAIAANEPVPQYNFSVEFTGWKGGPVTPPEDVVEFPTLGLAVLHFELAENGSEGLTIKFLDDANNKVRKALSEFDLKNEHSIKLKLFDNNLQLRCTYDFSSVDIEDVRPGPFDPRSSEPMTLIYKFDYVDFVVTLHDLKAEAGSAK